MNIVNWYGFGYMVIILIPNFIFAMKRKNGFENKRKNRVGVVEVLEKIGRIGCFGFMCLSIPET